MVDVETHFDLSRRRSPTVALVCVSDTRGTTRSASVTEWRPGDRRKAQMVGGSVDFFLLVGLGTAAAVLWGYSEMPIVFSLLYLGLVVVMGYELSRDLLRASQLFRELQISEAGLRESEARLSLAADAAGFGIWIRDLAGNDVWASEKCRELFGFTSSERLEFDAILQRLHRDDRAGLQQAHALAVAGANGGRYQTEYRVVLSDGASRWIASSGRVEWDISGQPVVIRDASRDITARKQAEQEMLLLRQEIAHAGRVSMMGQLASALAHEINQPLAAIATNTAAAERFLQQAKPDVGELRAILGDIRNDDERASAIIDRMRGFLRRHQIETRRLDVGMLVHEVASLLHVDAATRQVKLEVNVPRGLPQIWGDRVHLQQVLLNLILNGMDALDSAHVEDRRVDVEARVDGAQTVEIAIADRGPGIPEDALVQIFEPFFSTKPTGLGLGLAISRSIIDAHGGRLWAENKNDGGAAFRFTLPIAPISSTGREPSQTPSATVPRVLARPLPRWSMPASFTSHVEPRGSAGDGELFHPECVDPIGREPETADASGAQPWDIDLFYDLSCNLFVTPRRVPANIRAQNLNTIDEVPDSGWFTNCIGTHDIGVETVVRGHR